MNKRAIGPISAIVLCSLLTPFTASTEEPSWWENLAAPGFSGPVRSLEPWGDDLLVAGQFASNGSLATHTLAHWDGHRWRSVGGEAPFRNSYHAFSHAGQVIANGFEAMDAGPWRWDGTAWEVMGGGFESLVILAHGSYDGRLWVSTQTGGIQVWDGSSWLPETQLSGTALTFLEMGQYLYAGGFFTLQENSSNGSLARYDGTNWELLDAPSSMVAHADGMDPYTAEGKASWVLDLAEHDGELAIVGSFGALGGHPATNIIGLDPATLSWKSYPPLDGTIEPRAVASYLGQVHVGGEPGLIPGPGDSASLVRLDSGAWAEVGQSPAGVVEALHAGSLLYVAGDFQGAGGLPDRGLVAHDGTGYLPCRNPFGAGLNGRVHELISWEGRVVAVGDFRHGGTAQLDHVGMFDGHTWHPFPGGGADGPVHDAYADATGLYVVGDFSRIGGVQAEGLARWNGSAWIGLGLGLPARPSSITMLDGEIYVGSYQPWVDGTGGSRSGYLAHGDGSQWNIIPDSRFVYSLVTYGGEVWASLFSDPTNDAQTSFASTTGGSLEWRFPELNTGPVAHLKVAGDRLWILDTSSPFAWDGSSLQPMSSPILEYPADMNRTPSIGVVYDIVFEGGLAYLACNSTYFGISAWVWDEAAGVASALSHGTDGQAYSVLRHEESLYFGGNFALADFAPSLFFDSSGDAVPSGNIARWVAASGLATATPGRAVGGWARAVPNPFNPRCEIRFKLGPSAEELDLTIHDARGRRLRAFKLGPWPGGAGTVEWNGRSEDGRRLASGIYYFTLSRGGQTVVSESVTLVR